MWISSWQRVPSIHVCSRIIIQHQLTLSVYIDHKSGLPIDSLTKEWQDTNLEQRPWIN